MAILPFGLLRCLLWQKLTGFHSTQLEIASSTVSADTMVGVLLSNHCWEMGAER